MSREKLKDFRLLLKNVEIGRRLKEFAENNFSSIAEFSRQLGMNQRQDIYIYFSGKSLLGAERIAKLAELGCDINWLLNGTELKTTANIIAEPVHDYNTKSEALLLIEHLQKEVEQIQITLNKLSDQQGKE